MRTEATARYYVISASLLLLPIETGRAPQPCVLCVRIAVAAYQILLHCIVYRVFECEEWADSL